MPCYCYRCSACGAAVERMLHRSEDRDHQLCSCGSELQRDFRAEQRPCAEGLMTGLASRPVLIEMADGGKTVYDNTACAERALEAQGIAIDHLTDNNYRLRSDLDILMEKAERDAQSGLRERVKRSFPVRSANDPWGKRRLRKHG